MNSNRATCRMVFGIAICLTIALQTSRMPDAAAQSSSASGGVAAQENGPAARRLRSRIAQRARSQQAVVPFEKPGDWSDVVYRDRADDIKSLIKALKQDPNWQSAVDWSRIALAGHSLGAIPFWGWRARGRPGRYRASKQSWHCLPTALPAS